MAIALRATRLRCRGEGRSGAADCVEISLSEQGSVRARSVVIAAGARYRRPELRDRASFEGSSLHYWASPAEAKLSAGEEVALVGGGNSAGHAAVSLAAHVKHLTMVVRGEGLEASMSRYLIDRIKMLENVDMVAGSEVVALQGEGPGRLQAVTIRDRASGTTRLLPARQLFLFIGAEPNTAWLDGCVALDEKGYVLTGASPQMTACVPHELQTSMPGVFAIGDVRSGSTKRVASAVGEGAAVVAQIHSFLGSSNT